MCNRGVALPLAVLALLVMGVLVGTSFLLGRQELAVGRSSLRLQEALAAAEGGVNLQLALWDPTAVNALIPGESTAFVGVLPTGGWYRGVTRRLNDVLFLIRSEGFSRDSGARQEVGLLARLEPVEVARVAGFVTQGPVAVHDLAHVDGSDRAPPGWTKCGAVQPSVAGIHTDGDSVSTETCADPACVRGSPPVRADSGVDSTTLSTFGDMGFDDLRVRATVVVSGGTRTVGPSFLGGNCDSLDPDNWGDPTDPGSSCGGWFPVVWSEGDLILAGGAGQGVLIVDGSLTLGGAVTFHGAVIVRGRIATAGMGGTVYGTVVAVNALGVQQDIGGNSLIQFSNCSLDRALLGSAMAGPLRSRGWFAVR